MFIETRPPIFSRKLRRSGTDPADHVGRLERLIEELIRGLPFRMWRRFKTFKTCDTADRNVCATVTRSACP